MEKGEKKVHFKMYKAGRQWLVAGIAAFGFGYAVMTVQNQPVQTVVATSADQTTESQDLVLTAKDLVTNFTKNGSAIYQGDSANGTVALTQNIGYQSGNLTLNSKIDLKHDFSMLADITIGEGDGIAFGFHTDDTTKVGKSGGSLGFGGLSHSFGWKADTYHNDADGKKNNGDDTDLNGTPYFRMDPVNTPAYGGFVYTESNGITTYTDAKSAKKIKTGTNRLEVTYTAAKNSDDQNVLTVTLTNPGHQGDLFGYGYEAPSVQTWTTDITKQIPADGLVSFFVSGSTGLAKSTQVFTLKEFKYAGVGTAHLDFVDKATGEEIDNPIEVTGTLGSSVLLKDNTDYQEELAKLKAQGYSPADGNPVSVTAKADTQDPYKIYMNKEYKTTIQYIDDTDGGQPLALYPISSQTPIASISEVVNRQIEYFEKQGYQVRTTNPLQGFAFTPNTDGTPLVIHLTHSTTTLDPTDPATDQAYHDQLNKTVTQTINYVYGDKDDGKKIADSNVQEVKFTRTATYDNVTKQIVAYGPWTPVGDGNFKAVDSPIIKGYQTKTPTVTGSTADPNAASAPITVHYGTTPQDVTITYVDQNTGNTLKTDTVTGQTNEEKASPVASTIESYKALGYELVQDGDETKGAKTFTIGTEDQSYTVTLKHSTTTLDPTDPGTDKTYHDVLNKEINQTINYVYNEKIAGAKPIAPNVQIIKYSRTAVIDNVTKKIVSYGEWAIAADTPQKSFEDVISPVVAGYHADQTKVAALPADSNAASQTVIVHYSTTQQPINIQYFDSTDNKILKTDILKGNTGDVVENTALAEIRNFEAKGYTLVKDETDGAKTLTISPEDTNYQVTLKHATTTVAPGNPGNHADELARYINQTIKYVYADGSQAAPENHQTITYKRSATVDRTNDVATSYTDWTPVSGEQFADVTSPTIKGYGADEVAVVGVKITPEAATEQTHTVHYEPLDQPITIQFIQNGTGRILKTQKLTGKTDAVLNYDVEAVIAEYLKQGYLLVSNNVPEVGKMGHFKVNADGNKYEVHLSLAPKAKKSSSNVTEKQKVDTTSGEKKLPATGESVNQLGAIGLVVLAMTSLFAIDARKRG